MNLENLIKNKLNTTLNCDFKKKWFPKGYTCVNIEVFSKELAKEIKSKFYAVMREPK